MNQRFQTVMGMSSSGRLDRISRTVQELGLLTHKPFGATTAPRAAWLLLKRLPLPGWRLLARGLGRLGPVVNVGFAMADIWVAIDDWIKARRNPNLERYFSAVASSLLACCSTIAALNIPLISQLGAILALGVDFLKQSLLWMAQQEEIGLDFISNPTSGGGLVLTPAQMPAMIRG